MEKKTLWRILGIFFGIMALFTILSRVVYQRGTAVVRTCTPTRGTIDHTVRVSGKTTRNQEIAVTTQSGLRVGAVLASEGQQVKEGDVLFCLDMDYLNDKIETQNQELRKQQLSVQDAWSQSSAQTKRRENAMAQAEENYNAAVSSAEQARNRAKAAMDQAQKELDDYYAGVNGDTEKKAALEQALRDAEAKLTQAQSSLDSLLQQRQGAIDAAIAQADTGEEPLTQEEKDAIAAQVEAEYASQVQAAQETLAQAQAERDQAKQALADFTPGVQKSEQELLDALAKAKEAYEQAQSELGSTSRAYGQALETASLPDAGSNSAEIGQITYAQMKAQLQKLEALRDAGGEVLAPADGVVTACYVRTGQLTAETTAYLLADSGQGWKFTADVTREQSKYIGTGDKVTLRLESSGREYKDLPVMAFAAKDMGGTLTVSLPAADIPLGAGMELTFTRRSQAYTCCVPLTALHMDAQNRAYVLTLETVNTVLGQQTRAAKVMVTVLDKNEKTAALEGLLTDKQIIVSSDRTVDSGSRVRAE